MNAFWKIWIVLLTLWVAFDAWTDHNNMEARNAGVVARKQWREELAEVVNQHAKMSNEFQEHVNEQMKHLSEVISKNVEIYDRNFANIDKRIDENRGWLHKH